MRAFGVQQIQQGYHQASPKLARLLMFRFFGIPRSKQYIYIYINICWGPTSSPPSSHTLETEAEASMNLTKPAKPPKLAKGVGVKIPSW